MSNITICNFKGGVGKSLIAHQLITGFGYKGVEIDPYGSLNERLPEDVVKINLKDKYLPEIKEKSVFDFGGFEDSKLSQAVKASSLVIIPFIPTLETIQGTVDTIHKVKDFDTPILFVANMSQKKEDIKDAEFVFTEVLGFDIEVFQIPLSVALQTAINENKSVIDLSKQGGLKGYAYKKASKVITDLHEKIQEYID